MDLGMRQRGGRALAKLIPRSDKPKLGYIPVVSTESLFQSAVFRGPSPHKTSHEPVRLEIKSAAKRPPAQVLAEGHRVEGPVL
jgi:hypothetical protein